MSEALPSSLINISSAELNRAFSQGVDFTSTEAIHTYWKTYAASSRFCDDSAQTRCRNLFWRLLNSPQTAKSLTSLQLASLWQRCQAIQPFEPIWLPKRFNTSTKVQTADISAASDSGLQAGDARGTPGGGLGGGLGGLGIRATRLERSGSSDLATSPRQGPQARERNDPIRRTSTSGGTNGTSRPGVRRNTNSKGRIGTVGTNSRGKTRPTTIARRRSSQGRFRPATTQSSPRLAAKTVGLEGLTSAHLETLPGTGAKITSARVAEANFTLGSASSWQSIDEHPESSQAKAGLELGPTGSLVERDFRKTFVETQRMNPSATNLPALERRRKTGSVVRFEDAPEVIGREEQERAPSPAATSAQPLWGRERSDSNVISDSDEPDGLMMTRAESNLSKLIRNERRQSGGGLGQSTQGIQTRSSPKSSSTRRKEEEILEMGRKAAAPVIPKGRPGSETTERFRLPSPGATF